MLDASLPSVTKVEVASTQWTPEFVEYLTASNPQSHGYSIPRGSSAQSTTLAWTNLDQIIITFNKDVHVFANHLALTGVNVDQYFFQDFHYDPIAHTAIWTLTEPLNNDRVRIDLDGDGINPVIDLDWNALDGEWTDNSSVVSGDEVPGGDFEFTFNVLPTDIDNTASINLTDYLQILELDGDTIFDSGYISKRDINGDAVIDMEDWQEALARALQTLPSGSPAGANNDAPSATAFSLFNIDNDAVNLSIPLSSYFADLEDSNSSLTYSIVSNSNASRFESATINSSQSLVLDAASNVSGRAFLTIRATDTDGLSVDTTMTIDVKRDNIPPEILDFSITSYAYGIFIVSGRVVDADDDVSDALVDFWGVFSTRAAVDELGYFLFAVYLQRTPMGIEYASTVDIHGATSNIDWHDIFLT